MTRNRDRANKLQTENVWDGNVYFGDDRSLVETFGEHDVWADPLFIKADADAASADFGLQPGSPARGCGLESPLVSSHDPLGTPRPSDGKIDRGAIQSSAPAAK